jgi:hypothetical protein
VLGPKGQGNGDYFDIELEAGETTTLTATVGNGSAIPVEVIIYAADAYSDVNGGFAIKESTAELTGTTTWLDFTPETRSFGPSEGFDKTFTVTVPEGTPPGQYITGLAIETAESRPVPGNPTFRQATRLATAVFITVPGPVTPGFEISDLALAVTPFGHNLTGVITNIGNVRVRPEGSVTLVDASGAEIADIPIVMGSVYAHDTTTFVITLPTFLPEGDYQATAQLEDPDTGATATLVGVTVTAVEAAAPSPLSIASVVLTPMPSADNVVFVQVTTTINNTGGTMTGGELTLQVFKDGELVADHVLATSLTLATGDTVVDQPYIPAEGTWASGTYTFQVTLSTTDISTGATTKIGVFTSDQTIEIP